MRISTQEGIEAGGAPARVVVRFLTPVDIESVDIFEEPHSLVTRLARRIALLARWQDAAVDFHFNSLTEAAKACEWALLEGSPPLDLYRGSRRQGKLYKTQGRLLTFGIEGDTSAFWPLLALGTVTHVGRGTRSGMGRYELVSEA
jgi:hypothetical protein